MADNEEQQERSTLLILSVGTSNEPLIKSIDYNKPSYVVYLVSKESVHYLPSIEEAITWNGIKIKTPIPLSDPENITSCMKEIRAGLQNFIKSYNLPADIRLDADITGGMKPMSAALAQVVTEFAKCRICYVGGTQRNPEQRGIVVSGKEKFVQVDNPWDEMGYTQSRKLAYAFNHNQFLAAREEALSLKEKRHTFETYYNSIADIIDAFSDWDRFNYQSAYKQLDIALGKIKTFNNLDRPAFMTLYERLQNAAQLLKSIAEDADPLVGGKKKGPLLEDTGRKYLIDLLANARRCAKNGRYDDAVARLYSTIEKSAKLALKKLGKDNSNLTLDNLREAKGDFEEIYGAELGKKDELGKIRGAKLALSESFRYLQAIAPDHPLAKRYFENETQIKNALKARNDSLLAHGFTPIDKDHYDTLFQAALNLLEIDENELWDFPEIRPEEILI